MIQTSNVLSINNHTAYLTCNLRTFQEQSNQQMTSPTRPAYRRSPMFAYLLLLTICSTAGLHVWRPCSTISPSTSSTSMAPYRHYPVGRELPGFLSLLVVYVLLIVRSTVYPHSLFCCWAGVSLTGMMPSFYGLAFTTLIMSFGFHYFETTNQSLTLQYFDKNTAPVVFGKLRSFAAATNIVSGLVIISFSPLLEYRLAHI